MVGTAFLESSGNVVVLIFISDDILAYWLLAGKFISSAKSAGHMKSPIHMHRF